MPANATIPVICAWPVSGQYGPGTRMLYYVLVAACVVARKQEWLRHACLAAALVLPAIAALHGIVLVSLHNDDAVDLDIYGALQLCAIGILAAPVTAKLSKTYFFGEGRNVIFVWTGLVLAGLLSLTVEFFRTQAVPCEGYTSIGTFNYSDTCDLVCDPNIGPFSPLRGGSANNIYVVPAPYVISFGTATLLAAACCIPGLLSLLSMWIQILQVKWRATFASDAHMPVNHGIRRFLTAVEAPVYGAAVLAVALWGEVNFFSEPVFWQTEPFAAIGQWAPIAGTIFAVLGSLYIVLSKGEDPVPRPRPSDASRSDVGSRLRVARTLNAFADRFGMPAADLFDDSFFKQGKPADFPEIPGEEHRNEGLLRIRSVYNPERDEEGHVTPSLRAASVMSERSEHSEPSEHGGERSEREIDRDPRIDRGQRSPIDRTRTLSPPPQSPPRRARVNTLPAIHTFDGPAPRPRRETMASTPRQLLSSGQRSPAIVVSDPHGTTEHT